MKNVFLLAMTLTFLFGGAFAQTNYDTISATYSSGNISTDKDFVTNGVSSCPGLLNVAVPNNAIIVSVNVDYTMTAITGASMNNASSQLVCSSPGGLAEASITQGTGGWGQGTESYSRTGLTIANGVTPFFGFGVNFELHAGTAYWGAPSGCSDLYEVVDNNSWTVTVIFLPAGSPGTAMNPSPTDMEQLVNLNAQLTWDFGSATDTYDLYLDTNNPPATMVVSNATASGASGSYNPGTLLEATTYYWRVVGKNATNDNPGNVWSFTTKCAPPTYPYFENFDLVTSPDFPSCWIPLSSSTNEYSRVNNYYDTWGGEARSAPNVIQFNADAEPNPDMLLVLPEVGTVSDKILSLYGMNNTNWISGTANQFPIEVGTITDPSDINTFTPYTSYIPGANWTLLEVFFADYTGSDTYIAIKGVVPQYESLWMDDVTVDILPTCIKPIDLVANEVLAQQATISWTDMNGASAWNVEVVLADSVPTGIPTLTGVTNPTTITGLADGTYYDIYVQTDCGGGNVSAWSWPLRILTDCLPWDVPVFEDFGEQAPYPEINTWPLCWTPTSQTGAQFGGLGLQSGNNAYTGVAVWADAGGDATSQLILASPSFTPALNTLMTSFWAKNNGYSDSTMVVGTMTDPSDPATFTAYQIITGLTDEFQLFKVYFNNYVGSDTYIAYRHHSEYTAIEQLFFDDISIEAIPSCVEPYKPYVDGETNSSAMLNWIDPLSSATDYQIEVGAPGFTPGTGTASNSYSYNNPSPTGTDNYEMTGLSAATIYDVYIRTDCGAGDYSVWVGPVTFLTGFDVVSIPVTEDFESGMGVTLNDPANGVDWALNTDLFHNGANSIHNAYDVDNNNILYVNGTFDFTAKTDVMLSFWQIAKTDGKSDKCYIEISTDGGATYDQLPESTYAGTGRYREDDLYAPFDGPAFDEDSYIDWGTSNTTPENTWWKHEFFNLTDYNTYDNVVIRFRLWSNAYTNRAGWYIDDITVEALGTPGFNVDPLSINEDATATMPANIEMTMGNTGNFPATYTANIVYDEVNLLAENFDAGIPVDWTVVNNGSTTVTWTDTTDRQGHNFDGTSFAFADSNLDYGPVENTFDEELITPIIDASAYTGGALQLEFDQAFDHGYNAQDTARVYVYDGTDWIEIYKAWNDDGILSYNQNGVHKVYDVTQYANANFQVKYRYEEQSITYRGNYFAIDNFRLRASMFPLGWLTIDGAETTAGVALPDSDGLPSIVNVSMDATGLAIGTYTADIEVTSNDPGFTTTLVPVTFNVVAGATVSGTITYANTPYINAPLENCTVEFYNTSSDLLFTTTTDATGHYEFSGILDGDYTMETSSSLPRGGTTILDAIRTRQFLGGNFAFTALQQMAADVNSNLTVDILDAIFIQQSLSGALPAGWTAPDYVFEVQSVTVSGGVGAKSYQGMCSGDPDGSYIP